MKKITLLILLISTSLFSQIKRINSNPGVIIGELKNVGSTYLSLTKNDNFYTFTYKDLNYQHIETWDHFSFKDEDDIFINDLFDTILAGFKNKPKENIDLEIGDSIVYIEYIKSFGIVSCRFQHCKIKNCEVVGTSAWLTKKKFYKLFGKKYKR